MENELQLIANRQMLEAEKQLTDRYAAMNERLQKKNDRQETWGTIKAIVMGVAGIFVGRAF